MTKSQVVISRKLTLKCILLSLEPIFAKVK